MIIKKVVSSLLGFTGTIHRQVRKVLGWILGIPKPEDPRGMEIKREGSDHQLPVVYGERLVGGIVVHDWVTDSIEGVSGIEQHNRKNAYLHQIIAFCHGPVHSIDALYFNGEHENVQQYRGKYAAYRMNGSDTQNAIPQAVQNIGNWNADMRGRNVAYVYLVLYQDESQTIWRGEPEVQAVIRGRTLYDPRTGVTEYSSNPALAALDMLTNPIYGRGLNANRIDMAAFSAAADFCDEGTSSTVSYTICEPSDQFDDFRPVCRQETRTVNNPRYRIDAILSTDATVFDNYRELLQVFRAYPRRPNGLVSLHVETVAPSNMPTFDDTELVGKIKYQFGGQRGRYNRFKIRFPNKLNRYERDEFTYPPKDDPLYQQWLDEDNGKELIGELELNTIADKTYAAQNAEIAAKSSRLSGLLSVTLPPRARLLEPGDIIGINSDLYGWTAKPFRIQKLAETTDGAFETELREHEDAAYTWSGSAWNEQIGGTWLGNPAQPDAPINLQIFPDPTLATGGRLTWQSVNDAFVREYEVVISQDGDVVFDNRTRGTAFDLPLLDVGEYTVQVFSVTTLGYRSAPATISFNLTAPVAPTDLGLTASNNTITVRPSLPGRGLGTQFEAAIVLSSESDGFVPEEWMRGDSIVFTGLHPNTLYRIFVRTVNALGVSAWVSDEIRTTESTAELDYLIDKSLPFIDLRDRVDEEFERSSERLDGLEVDTRIERFRRDETDAALIESIADSAGYRDELARRIARGEKIINAEFVVDPETGQIRARAYEYTDDKFSEASLIIDGVQGQVNAAVQRITLNESEVEELNAEFDLLPGLIELTANAVFAEGIAALQPAHSFNFFDSAQGWVAVSGTLTPNHNKIVVTHGDIENTGIEYNGEEDPSIRIALTRTAGEGWTGDVVVYFDDATQHTFEGVIDEVSATDVATIRNLDFRGSEEYHRNIVGLRLVLGADVQDEFEITAIAIGKPDAALLELEGVIAQVTEVGMRIDAVNAEIEQRVTRTEYDATVVKRTDFSQILNADEGYAEIRGVTQQIIDNDVVGKAMAAGLFIDETFTAYSEAIENRLDAESELNETRYTNVQQELDAVGGTLTNQVFSISRLSSEQQDALASQIEALADYGLYVLGQKDVEISFARSLQQLRTDVSPDGALAQSILDLEAVTNQQNQTATAWLQRNEQAITDTQNALTQSRTELEAQIEQRGEAAEQTATANASDLLNARVGYCAIDGQPTGAETPDACSAAGGEWVSAPLAEVLRTVRVQVPGGGTATVSQIAQAFQDKDGQLVARGALITDNDGRISGMVNTNTGETSQLDLIAALTRIGDVDAEGNFIPLLALDAVERVLNIRARLVLKDGHVVEDLDDIRAEDGKDGEQGPPGVPGEPGADGVIYYTWIRYADGPNGEGISNDPTGKAYMGLAYNKDSPTESNNPDDYEWTRFRGEDGTDGVPGAPGEDGQPTYTWIAYSDNANGTPKYQVPTDNTKFIGIAVNKDTPVESDNPADYTWSRFRGEDGQDGVDGQDGLPGADGADGAPGAGFFSGEFSTINWGVARGRFRDVVGRWPIPGDIFVMTTPSGGFDARKRNADDDSWVAPGILLDGDFIATGTVGARHLASESVTTDKLAATALYGKRQLIQSGNSTFAVDPGTVLLPSNLLAWSGTTADYNNGPTRQNGSWWVDTNGRSNAPIWRGYGSGTSPQPITMGTWRNVVTANHQTVRGLCEITGEIGTISEIIPGATSPPSGNGTLEIRVIDSSNNVVYTTTRTVFYDYEGGGMSDGFISVSMASFTFEAVDNNGNLPYYTNKNYRIQARHTVPSFSTSIPVNTDYHVRGTLRSLEIRDN